MKIFKLEKLQIAYDENDQLKHIDFATRSNTYFLFKNKKIELVLADGIKNKKHWRRKIIDDKDDAYLVSRGGETELHLNAKRHINITSSIFNIEGSSSVLEKYIPSIKMTPDITIYDKEGDVLIYVEIMVTHEKSSEDIEKLKTLNKPVLELGYEGNNYKKPKTVKWIVIPNHIEEQVSVHYARYSKIRIKTNSIRERIRNGKESVRDVKQQIQDADPTNTHIGEQIKDAEFVHKVHRGINNLLTEQSKH